MYEVFIFQSEKMNKNAGGIF